jgi:hypothetical protein
MDAIDYTPSHSFVQMSGLNISNSFAGLVSGILINQIGSKLYDSLNITDKNVKIIGQIVLCSIFLAFIHTKISNKFGWEWQSITPGLFFIAFFFGVQYLSFTSIQEVYGVKRL